MVEDPFRCCFSSGVPSDALVIPPVISLDVPVTHPYVVAPIGGSEATSSTAMEDLVATHMSPIHDRIYTFAFVEGEVQCNQPQRVMMVSQILLM